MEVKIENAGRLQKNLARLADKFGYDKTTSVTVGFTQRYALYVHEVQANHVVGQWQYLRTPARRLTRQMARMTKTALQRGLTMLQALMFPGLLLQREAQLLTPVDTSALKASAFTCPTKDVDAISQAAFTRSENIRIAEMAARGKKAGP